MAIEDSGGIVRVILAIVVEFKYILSLRFAVLAAEFGWVVCYFRVPQ